MMNKELLTKLSSNSKVFENVTICGVEVPFVATGNNGIFLCLNDDNPIMEDITLYVNIKNELGYKYGKIFLFRFHDEKSGCFYDGRNIQFKDDIYDAYQNCYAFTSLFLNTPAVWMLHEVA